MSVCTVIQIKTENLKNWLIHLKIEMISLLLGNIIAFLWKLFQNKKISEIVALFHIFANLFNYIA